MTLAPENATSVLAEAPPDRPTADLEGHLTQALAIILRDGGIDENEMRPVRGFLEQLTLKIQQQGGLARADVAAAQQQQPGMSPYEQNATGAEDYGNGAGEPTGEEY